MPVPFILKKGKKRKGKKKLEVIFSVNIFHFVFLLIYIFFWVHFTLFECQLITRFCTFFVTSFTILTPIFPPLSLFFFFFFPSYVHPQSPCLGLPLFSFMNTSSTDTPWKIMIHSSPPLPLPPRLRLLRDDDDCMIVVVTAIS